jgi:enoyl-CoA hydratase
MSVDTTIDGSVLTIVLNRPEKRNAIDGAMTTQLRVVLDEFEANSTLLIAILTGAGGTFCAGADLRAGPAGEAIRDEYGFASFTSRRRQKPVIAAIEGNAYAGGFEIALTCDLVVAASDARFAIPEVKRGVMAGPGIWRLGREVPFATAALIVLSGEPIDAPRAYELGLVSELVEPGQSLERATQLARVIASHAPGSIRETLGLLRDSVGASDENATDLARKALGRLSKTDDFREGPRAFIEHRPPKWTGH